MKRLITAAVFVLVVMALIASLAFAGGGNGAPSGAHYNLNLIGVKDKSADMTAADGKAIGHRIFVKLWGTSKIWLSPGEDFAVTDANGTDSNGAAFTLPADVATTYYAYARALGKPGGEAKISTCYYDPATGEDLCSLDPLELKRYTGKSTFSNVSKELLYIYADLTDDGVYNPVYIPLFDDSLEGVYWYWLDENKGLKLVQLRFYPQNP